jgi:hypothetical protein
MVLTKPERIIFPKTTNASLGAPPQCGSLGSRITLQSNHVRNGAEKA